MNNYEKPIVLANDELSEGVFAASGDDCYSVDAYMHQSPQLGRGDYRFQFNAVHGAADGHHSGAQTLTVNFNMAVEYKSSGGSYMSGNGTTSITISYSYHNNAEDKIGLGDLVVEADQGLIITSASLSCNHDCGQH